MLKNRNFKQRIKLLFFIFKKKEKPLPFVLKQYFVPIQKKIQLVLIQDLSLDLKLSQRFLSRGRIFDSNNNAYKISDYTKEEYIYIAVFEGQSRGLKPLATFKDFAIFDKPTHLIVHPISKKTTYSLLDEVRYFFGSNANLVHRIDAETSGLILCSRNKKSEKVLKTMFENKEFKKSYLAIVEGKIENKIIINKAIRKEGKKIGVRMATAQDGKESKTIIYPIKYDENKNQTLVKAVPITGRQHQIRVHLYSIGHKIVGDPIYGVDDDIVEKYLQKELSKEERLKYIGHSRLCLQAHYIEFIYKKILYIFKSQKLIII